MARITGTPIDVSRVMAEVADDTAGGTVVFVGTVRNHHRGKSVVELEYEAYDRMAEAKMNDIEREARKRWPIKQISVVHRKGKLKVGDVSVVVAVSAEHRSEAFEASRFVIDTLKRTVPIWKRETTPEGKTGWVEGERIEELQVTEDGSRRGTKKRQRRSRA